MKILLTGANGYIGQRLLPILVEAGHEIVAMVRSSRRLQIPPHCQKQVQVLVGDLLKPDECEPIPDDIDAAYYLVHSLTQKKGHLTNTERQAAEHFLGLIKNTNCRQVIYLSGLISDEELSPHLHSRKSVEDVLRSGPTPVTTLRAGIILGSGSASFEIIRDLVEKLPVMVAPRWVKNKVQPIGIFDTLEYLVAVLDNPKCFDDTFDIGGPEVLTYKEMLQKFAELRGLKRWIISVPVLTPKLSSYWLHFITSTNVTLASALIESLRNNAVCRDQRIKDIIPKECLPFKTCLERTFAKIEDNAVLSSWKDSLVFSDLNPNLREYIQVPQFGVLNDEQSVDFEGDPEKVLDAIWAIGGDRGWYYMNWAWTLRGIMDQMILGAGLRRGRTHPTRIRTGDALDFWRVILADREQGRLLLYAEMKVPGEAWLEFEVTRNENSAEGSGGRLRQTATFRPSGVLGRLYWYSVFPFHWFVFHGMANAIVDYAAEH